LVAGGWFVLREKYWWLISHANGAWIPFPPCTIGVASGVANAKCSGRSCRFFARAAEEKMVMCNQSNQFVSIGSGTQDVQCHLLPSTCGSTLCALREWLFIECLRQTHVRYMWPLFIVLAKTKKTIRTSSVFCHIIFFIQFCVSWLLQPSFGWWLMAGADLFWEKSTTGWLLAAGLLREKSTAGWWLISQANRLLK
jgi:hypothetical protein